MKKVLILGAGMVTKPMVDYFLDKCKYQVVIATRTVLKAQKIINNRKNGSFVKWTTDQIGILDDLVKNTDLVVSMIPPTMHIPVAKACLKYNKNIVTTSFISPEMAELDQEAKSKGLIFLNEIGEDPGIDHMGAKKLIDEIKSEGGYINSLTSYGAGLPSFEHNENPFGYKFSWSPKGVLLAAKTPAAYLKNGVKVDVPGDNLFDNYYLVNLDELGTFETYPNRDCLRYLKDFELDENVSLYRGLLRNPGWCNTIRSLIKLNLLDNNEENSFENKTYKEFILALIGKSNSSDAINETAKFLDLKNDDDIINRLSWLGLFNTKKISIKKGTNADLLVDLMTCKMSYKPNEKDMIIVHNEIIAKFSDKMEKRISTMVLEGIPNGDSAMSRAVSLPAAIASRLILENKITATGLLMPTLSEIYKPVLNELEDFGLKFKYKTDMSFSGV